MVVGPEPHIGTLNEGSLHAALKRRYAEPGDQFEVAMEGFVVDIVRNEGMDDELLIEVQTGAFGSMGSKLDRLLSEHRMLLVHPIAARTRLDRGGKLRRSPKKGSVYSLFDELVSIPTLLDHPNLELDVVVADVVKVQIEDPKARRGRGGWRTVDRQLETVLEVHRFTDVADLTQLLPASVPDRFTTADIAQHAEIPRDAAQKLAYCFRAACLIDELKRTRAGIEYRRTY